MDRFWRIWGIVSIGIIVVLVAVGIVWVWQSNKDQVIGKVGDENVYYSEWFNELKDEYGREVLDQLLNRIVVSQAAAELQIDITDAEVEQELERMKKGYASEEEFMNVIGGSLEGLKEDIRFNLMLEAIAIHDVVVSDREVEAFYEENIDLYTEPAAIHLHQIVVDTRDEANQVIQELKGGANFAVIAQEQSTDLLSAANGGDLGWVTYEDPSIDTSVLEVAEDLPLGEISNPIPVFSGYAIIMVEDRKERQVMPFESVKEQIRKEIALGEVESLPSVLKKLKQAKGIKIHKMFQE